MASTQMISKDEFLQISTIMADEAGQIALKYFRNNFDIETKSDDSPVTIADKAIEKKCREILEDKRPQDGICGEEFGIKTGKNNLTWLLDPIDGTKQFITGRPTFGTLIGLCENGIPRAGIIDQPILKERWMGLPDNKTTFQGQPAKTSSCISLAKARCGSTSPTMFNTDKTEKILKTLQDSTYTIQWGSDCYAYGLLASGHMDIVIERQLNTYDFAALVPVVHGAGGIITDWSGNPITTHSNGDIIASANPVLHEQVLAILQQT